MSRKKYSVEWTTNAYSDLEEIINYIIADNPANAENILNHIQAKTENLYFFRKKEELFPNSNIIV